MVNYLKNSYKNLLIIVILIIAIIAPSALTAYAYPTYPTEVPVNETYTGYLTELMLGSWSTYTFKDITCTIELEDDVNYSSTTFEDFYNSTSTAELFELRIGEYYFDFHKNITSESTASLTVLSGVNYLTLNNYDLNIYKVISTAIRPYEYDGINAVPVINIGFINGYPTKQYLYNLANIKVLFSLLPIRYESIEDDYGFLGYNLYTLPTSEEVQVIELDGITWELTNGLWVELEIVEDPVTEDPPAEEPITEDPPEDDPIIEDPTTEEEPQTFLGAELVPVPYSKIGNNKIDWNIAWIPDWQIIRPDLGIGGFIVDIFRNIGFGFWVPIATIFDWGFEVVLDGIFGGITEKFVKGVEFAGDIADFFDETIGPAIDKMQEVIDNFITEPLATILGIEENEVRFAYWGLLGLALAFCLLFFRKGIKYVVAIAFWYVWLPILIIVKLLKWLFKK